MCPLAVTCLFPAQLKEHSIMFSLISPMRLVGNKEMSSHFQILRHQAARTSTLPNQGTIKSPKDADARAKYNGSCGKWYLGKTWFNGPMHLVV